MTFNIDFRRFTSFFDDFQILKYFEKNLDDFRQKMTIKDYGVIFYDVDRRQMASNGVKWRQMMSFDVN